MFSISDYKSRRDDGNESTMAGLLNKVGHTIAVGGSPKPRTWPEGRVFVGSVDPAYQLCYNSGIRRIPLLNTYLPVIQQRYLSNRLAIEIEYDGSENFDNALRTCLFIACGSQPVTPAEANHVGRTIGTIVIFVPPNMQPPLLRIGGDEFGANSSYGLRIIIIGNCKPIFNPNRTNLRYIGMDAGLMDMVHNIQQLNVYCVDMDTWNFARSMFANPGTYFTSTMMCWGNPEAARRVGTDTARDIHSHLKTVSLHGLFKNASTLCLGGLIPYKPKVVDQNSNTYSTNATSRATKRFGTPGPKRTGCFKKHSMNTLIRAAHSVGSGEIVKPPPKNVSDK